MQPMVVTYLPMVATDVPSVVKAVTAEAVVALVALHSVVEMANSVAEALPVKAMMVSGESMVLADCEALDSPSPGRGRTGKGHNDQGHQERPKDDPILPMSRFHHSPSIRQAIQKWPAHGRPFLSPSMVVRQAHHKLRAISTAAANGPELGRDNRS